MRATFAAGASGTFVFAWTDDWARSGVPVDDWDFGVTTRAREPKPALAALTTAYADVPFADDQPWPRISVVCCSYNGSRFIGDCLSALARQDYPDYEVIVIDDGSTDTTAEIARGFDVDLVSTPNQGLSAARNEGLARASGEVVAYIDDDAYPDQDWLRYLGWVYMTAGVQGAGGPNLPPPGDGRTAELVALAPGGPNHVLRTDTVAEHVPGCNSSYRTDALRAIGGYDTRFRTAGDDVDVGWRIQEAGGTIGFSAGAMVWHHRRGTAKGYLKQQRGYGYAEALLERKWPSRSNRLGHVTWPGQLYGPGARPAPLASSSIYGGSWGMAPYQSIYERSSALAAAPLMPEWWMSMAALVVVGLVGLTWPPLLLAWPVALAMLLGTLVISLAVALDAFRFARLPTGEHASRVLALAGARHGAVALSDPGPTRWRTDPVPATRGEGLPRAPHVRLEEWSETWHAMEARLRVVEERLDAAGVAARRGGDYGALGPRGAHWLVRVGAPRRHGRGARPRQPDGPLADLAARVARLGRRRRPCATARSVGIRRRCARRGRARPRSGPPRSGSGRSSTRVRRSRRSSGASNGEHRSSPPHHDLPYLARHVLAAVAVLVITVLTVIAELLVPWALKIVVDNVLGGARSGRGWGTSSPRGSRTIPRRSSCSRRSEASCSRSPRFR